MAKAKQENVNKEKAAVEQEEAPKAEVTQETPETTTEVVVETEEPKTEEKAAKKEVTVQEIDAWAADRGMQLIAAGHSLRSLVARFLSDTGRDSSLENVSRILKEGTEVGSKRNNMRSPLDFMKQNRRALSQ